MAELCCNTNNFLERFFGAFKYTFCQQKRQQRLVELLRIIVEKVIPHYLRDRLKKEAGLLTEKYKLAKERHGHNVRVLTEGGMIRARSHPLRAAVDDAIPCSPPPQSMKMLCSVMLTCMQPAGC